MSRVAYSIVCVVMVGILLAVSLAACGAEPTLVATPSPLPATSTPLPPTATPLPTPTPTPVPTPTPALPSAEALLETAVGSLSEVDSYHTAVDLLLELEADGMTVEMPMTVVGDFVPPDRLQGTMVIGAPGEMLEMSVVVLGETAYVTDPETGEWLISPEPLSLLPTEGMDQLAPEDMEELEVIGKESLDGVPVYHLQGLVSTESLGLDQLGLEADMEAEFRVEYWIGVEDGLLRKSALEGEFEVSGEEPVTAAMTMTAIYSGYGESVNIQAPVITAAAPPSGSAIAEQLDCDAAGEGFVAYGDDELGIGFCYPSGWVVDDTVEMSGLVSLSPQGFGPGETLSDCLVLIYPHEMVAQFSEPTAEAEEIVGLGFTFFVMIVQDATTDEWPSATSIDGQEVATLEASGTVEGEAVLGRISGIKREEAMGMAISYVLDEETCGLTAEAVMDSVLVALPKSAQTGEVRPIALNEFQEGSWTADQPGLHSFQVEGGTPVLLVGQLLAQGGMDDKADLRILGPEGVFVEQFTTGWMGAQTYSDSETFEGLVQHNVFGYLQPDALRVVLEQGGEYTISVSGGTLWHDEGKYRLSVLDMRAGAPGVLDVVEGELAAGKAYEYGVDGVANRSTIAYLRPTGPQAEDLTLSLELLDEEGQRLEERHNYSYSGDDVFLYWLPRDDVPYSVRVTEIDGQPAEFEFTMLQEPPTEEPDSASLSCDEYSVDIAVQANGDLLVEERQTLTFGAEATQEAHRTILLDGRRGFEEVEVWEGDQQYTQSESGEAGTYMVVEEEDGLVVKWFPAPVPDSSSTFTLRYTVRGGVQQDDEGRDVVAWQAIPPDRNHRVRSGQVVVKLPAEVEVHEIIAFGAQGTGSAKCDSFDAVITDEVTFELSHDLLPGQEMDIRVIYGPE